MKFLTKEFKKDLELNEIRFTIDSREKRVLPVFFLSEGYDGVSKSDIISVKTNFNNISNQENELNFILLPATFSFFNDYSEDAFEKEIRSPKNDFLSQYANRLRIISYLPQDILKQIKDKRLLALGYAEPKVKKSIIKYSKAKTKVAFQILEKSLEESLKAVSELTIEKQFQKHEYIYSIEELFDETVITNVIKEADNIFFELDGENIFVLSEVEILEQEIDPLNTCIEHFELYNTERGYELHFLLMTKDDNMVENFHYVTYRFKDMSFCNI